MTLPEYRTRLNEAINMHVPTLKLGRGWCAVNNWTLFMHAMTSGGNDQWMNDYRKQNAMATVFTRVQTRLTQSTWLINICLFSYLCTSKASTISIQTAAELSPLWLAIFFSSTLWSPIMLSKLHWCKTPSFNRY